MVVWVSAGTIPVVDNQNLNAPSLIQFIGSGVHAGGGGDGCLFLTRMIIAKTCEVYPTLV
jgi:hypothetical protein